MKFYRLFLCMAAMLLLLACTQKEPVPADPGQPDVPEQPEQPKEPEQPEEPDYSGILTTLIIETPYKRAVDRKDTWVENAKMWSVSPKGDTTFVGTHKIRLRGNSTQYYPKKPYYVKFDSKVPLLGMTKGKKWCFLANWMDRTLMRNDIAFELARRSPGLDWTPDGRFAEVVLNGKILGNYYVCEKITISGSRVNISEPGGFLLELDSYFDEVNKFYSKSLFLPVNIKEPDEDDIREGDYGRILNAFNEAEDAVMRAGADTSFRKLIDIDSFIDWWIVMELSENAEAYHPKSSYMYCDKDMVFHAGPVWDFDWATFVPTVNDYVCKECIWYSYLFRDQKFRDRVKEKWAEQKEDYIDVLKYIDSLREDIEKSALENCKQWPITIVVNQDEQLSWPLAVSRVRNALNVRINWLDTKIKSL